jgi:hypothetical protein
MILLNVILMAAVTVGIVGFLTGAICTQHRGPAAHIRRRRRLQVTVKLMPLDRPGTGSSPRVAL